VFKVGNVCKGEDRNKSKGRNLCEAQKMFFAPPLEAPWGGPTCEL